MFFFWEILDYIFELFIREGGYENLIVVKIKLRGLYMLEV